MAATQEMEVGGFLSDARPGKEHEMLSEKQCKQQKDWWHS
jgi:hypothetical protein